jgi:hypothetical protein
MLTETCRSLLLIVVVYLSLHLVASGLSIPVFPVPLVEVRHPLTFKCRLLRLSRSELRYFVGFLNSCFFSVSSFSISLNSFSTTVILKLKSTKLAIVGPSALIVDKSSETLLFVSRQL